MIGSKGDPAAAALFAVAQRESGWYKRIEWWDVAEGPLPNPDRRYPVFERPAAFVCTNGRCSLPVFEESRYQQLIARLRQ